MEGEEEGEDLFEDEELSVRSDHEVEVEQQIGLQPAHLPVGAQGGFLAPDQEPDQEPDDVNREGLQPEHQEGDDLGHREGDGPQRREGGEPPDPPGHLPSNEVWITPMGTRYHLSRTCPTLANSRVIRRSDWCQYCSRREVALVRPRVHVATPGDIAHVDNECIMVGHRFPSPFPCCQMCPTPRGH